MLYLTDQLNLNLQNGDRIEITVIETPNGGVRLGISAPNHSSLQKALADVEVLPARKSKHESDNGQTASDDSRRVRRHAKR